MMVCLTSFSVLLCFRLWWFWNHHKNWNPGTWNPILMSKTSGLTYARCCIRCP